jgi:hypothetical protein
MTGDVSHKKPPNTVLHRKALEDIKTLFWGEGGGNYSEIFTLHTVVGCNTHNK